MSAGPSPSFLSPPPSLSATPGEGPEQHRLRLLLAMLVAVEERGYADTTIADIVRHAHVSKRTFYQHFPDKESCFLETYLAVAGELIGRIATAAAQGNSVRERLTAASRVYFSSLEARPEITRTFLSDIHAAGPKALSLRRKIHQQFADTLRNIIDAQCTRDPEMRPLSRELATALVGGINELILLALDEGHGDRLQAAEKAATELVFSVLNTLGGEKTALP